MRNLPKFCLWMMVGAITLAIPGVGFAAPKADADPCAAVNDMDEKNLCRAFEIEKKLTAEEKENRYKNKNHSSYYCSLIKSRDKQTYCYAVVNKERTQCGLIVDADLEKQCNTKF
ncbi:hypothetical protein [Nitrospina watsonii]|uniref:Uncharacterized protein n=1 Tax=Nitrospina watsonii TaxID=1323948 RepID=A0ABM9HEU5_9BACT|nr:hypothetical protein [Nitrospina watsonii]CAI2718772.1 conserved exported protein of unknown function [Nitrospina watsonii]